MFTTRLISGIVLVIIAAFLLVEGSTVLYFASLAISLIGLFELYRVMKIERSAPGYVGYGHQLQKGERFPKTLTRQRADLLLRTDLLRHLRLYARYGRDAYLLATLSYQIGPAKLLGNGRYPKASLLTRLERGDRDILPLYLSYCKWRGKAVASIRKRRWVEYQLLYAER